MTRLPICRERMRRWIETVAPTLALVHGDPRCPDLLRATADAAAASGAFLVGGLMSHNTPQPLLAGQIGTGRDNAGSFGAAGLSGLLLTSEVAVATGLTQGCMPIGPVRRIDEARDNVVMTIDGRPALTVFYEDIGPELARDPRRLGGVVFVGLPVPGSDTGDYLVRNLMAIDPRSGWIAIAAAGRAGRPDPVLPPRSRQRPRRSRPHAAAAQGPAAGSAARRHLCQLHRPRRRAVRRAGGRDRR